LVHLGEMKLGGGMDRARRRALLSRAVADEILVGGFRVVARRAPQLGRPHDGAKFEVNDRVVSPL
jgi:hypothetical protein